MDGIWTSIRQDEFTGENRCLPCTVVNLIISALLAGIIGYYSRGIGIIGFGLSALLIYLRGYLIPKTPYITQEYFPDSVLRAFGKSSGHADDKEVEQLMEDLDILKPEDDADTSTLNPSFEKQWRQRLKDRKNKTSGKNIISQLFLPENEFEVKSDSEKMAAMANGQIVGRWPSKVSRVVDVISDRTLRDYAQRWEHLGPQTRLQILFALRKFVKVCPNCGGQITTQTIEVDSCCGPVPVIEAQCTDCSKLLFKVET